MNSAACKSIGPQIPTLALHEAGPGQGVAAQIISAPDPKATRSVEHMHAHGMLLPRHFAFMRAIIEGMDARQSWARYLAMPGAAGSPRQIRETIALINDAFTAAARRHRRRGPARLPALDIGRNTAPASGLPSLAEFVRLRDLENFSEAEQLESYRTHYGETMRRNGRHARLVARQLAALRWLERLPEEQVARHDRLNDRLAPELFERLAMAGLRHPDDLRERIAIRGSRWWHGIPGIGPVKAARIVAQAASFGLAPAALGAGLDASRIRPLHLAVVTEPPLAAAGPSAPPADCRIAAASDLEALRVWLHAKRAGAGVDRADLEDTGADTVPGWEVLTNLTHTQRAYWKEAERFQLWLYLERGSSLSLATAGDCRAYQAFLEAPGAPWCGLRAQARHGPTWRPFTGSLSPAARKFTCTVLQGLFRYLVRVGYLQASPWSRISVAVPEESAGPPAQAGSIRAAQAFPVGAVPSCAERRLRVALLLRRDSGLSAAALARLTTRDLLVPAVADGDWRLRLPGVTRTRESRALKVAEFARMAVLGSDTAGALLAYLAGRGIDDITRVSAGPEVPLLGRASDARQRAPWAPCARSPVDPAGGISAGTLRDQLRRFMHSTSPA